jgi:hypothetical protein
MDPTQTLSGLLSSLKEGDKDSAIDSLFALIDWLDTGGFLPDVDEAIDLLEDRT